MSTTYLLSGKESVNILHSIEICSVQGVLAGKYLKGERRKKNNQQHISFSFYTFMEYPLLYGAPLGNSTVQTGLHKQQCSVLQGSPTYYNT